MSTIATPEFVAAEVAYRFETGRVRPSPVRTVPGRRHRVGRWVHELIHPSRGQHSRARPHRTRAQRA